MSYLLNLVYLALIVLASPWLFYAALRKGKYREGLAQKLFGRVPRRTGERKCVWLHAVSVGELNAIAPLLQRLVQRYPNRDFAISTTTKTGYDLAQKKYPAHTVFYCPLDFSWAVREAIRRIRADVLILAELELWPNLLRAARRHGTNVAVVNGRLSEKSFRGYRRIRWLIAPLLRSIDIIAVQNESYAKRFRELGASSESVAVTGSLKFDGAETDRDNPRTRNLAAFAGITSEDIIFLAGSTQAVEEAMALEAFRKLSPTYPRLRLILVPRHPERFDEVAASLLDRCGLPWQRRSELTDEQRASNWRILLVDTIGELGAWWGTAHIAYVGGSIGRRGGQNMIEPAAYGAAVSFGPDTWNFRDVVEMLLERDAARVVHNLAELTDFVQQCLDELDFALRRGERARQLVQEQLGAADRTVERLGLLMNETTASIDKHRSAA